MSLNPDLLVVLVPAACAAALALIGSWRTGLLLNAASCSLFFLLACVLPLLSVPGDDAAVVLLLVTGCVAMTTSWYGFRDVTNALEQQSLHRRDVQLYHIACQALLAAVAFALLAGDAALNWLGVAVATAAASAMAPRLLLPNSIALVLAFLGTLLGDVAPDAAGVLLLLGYGGLAGLVPLHGWLAAAAEAPLSGGIIITTLLVNAPLLVLLRAGIAPVLLIGFGLASLFVGAALLFSQTDLRRTVAFAGLAQLGMIVCAVGVGGLASLGLVLLALTRAAALQSRGSAPAMLVLAVLPLFLLFLLAGRAVDYSAWLLLPFGGGALLTSLGVLRNTPAEQPTATPLELAPIWLQLALVAALALAMPRPLAVWFG